MECANHLGATLLAVLTWMGRWTIKATRLFFIYPKRKTLIMTGKNRIVAKVQSHRHAGEVYEISVDPAGGYTCSCPAFRRSKGRPGRKQPCRHLLAFFGREQAGPFRVAV